MRLTNFAISAILMAISSSSIAACPKYLSRQIDELGFKRAKDSSIKHLINCVPISKTGYIAFTSLLQRTVKNTDTEQFIEYDLLAGLINKRGLIISPTIQPQVGDSSAFFLISNNLKIVGSHYGAPVLSASFTSRNSSSVSYGESTTAIFYRFTPEFKHDFGEPTLSPLTAKFAISDHGSESGSKDCSYTVTDLSHQITLVPKGNSRGITNRRKMTASAGGENCIESEQDLGTTAVVLPTTSTWIEIPKKWGSEYANDAVP